jgi:HEAT repeat protein
MRKQSFDEKLSRLREAAGGPISAETVEILRDAVNGDHCVLAAVAVEIVGLRRITDLAPDLVKAFSRFMEGDKQCQVKTAVVDALHRMEYEADDVFLRGVRHVQMKPCFGGKVDTAPNMRAGCALALAQMRHPDAPYELVRLLTDPNVNPRKAAVKGLAHMGGIGAEMAIRLKALTGDGDPEVMGECFNALISLAPDKSLGFVGEFLESANYVVAEQAALALGQSHEAEAFEMLREHWEENFDPEFRRILVLPIALLRRDDAFAFLVEVIENRSARLAKEAVTSLGVYADEQSRRKVREAVKHRNDPEITRVFTSTFGAE